MKKLLKFFLSGIVLLTALLGTPVHAEWWAKGADSGLYTNGGNGLANSDIHVAHCYIGTGTGTPCAGGGGSVTSVGLALPDIFTVSGSPVTGSGTLTGTLNTQDANLVFAGPSSGGAATPTFRALVASDLPAGTGVALGGTQTGFTNGMVQYIAQDGTQTGDTGFTRDSNTFETNINAISGGLSTNLYISPTNVTWGTGVLPILLNIDANTNIIAIGDNSGGIGNGTRTVYDDPNKKIISTLDKQFLINSTLGNNFFNLDIENRNFRVGDNSLQYNQAYFDLDDTTSTFEVGGNKGITQSSISFSGSGVDDLTTSNSLLYTGPTGNAYTVSVANASWQSLTYVSLTGGSFNVGDTVTGSISGATGTVIQDVGSSVLRVDNVVGGPFQIGDVVDNGSGVTATLDTATPLTDIITWTSTAGGSGFGFTSAGTVDLDNGVSITFGATLGHDVGDQWTWSYTIAYGRMLYLFGQNRLYSIGDVDDVGNKTKTVWDDNAETIYSILDGIYSIRSTNVTPNPVFAADTLNMAVYGGDIQLAVNGTRFSVMDALKQIKFAAPNGTITFGDPDSLGSGDTLILDDTVGSMIGKYPIVELGQNGIGNNSYWQLSDSSAVSILRADTLISNITSGQFRVADPATSIVFQVDVLNNVTSSKTGQVQSNITQADYGSTTNLTTSMYDLEVGYTGSGAATVNLPTIPTVGEIHIISDLGANALLNMITIDAGTGNVIVGASAAQTYVISTNGEVVTLKFIGSFSGVNTWKIQ